ncbi:MAG TPA: hypothetical protein DCY88_24950 [Cyanobacteria bacterium UBA11372]|nr:hypothetical protein [Cyanobacteria bacterium UBA11372]
MARKKRFSALQRALNLLRPQGTAGESGQTPDAPAGTRLRYYQDWRKGAREVSYTRVAASNPGKLESTTIELFTIGGTNNKATAKYSKRSGDVVTNIGLSPTALGYGTVAANFLGNYVPAKITVYTGGARSTTSTPSKLTGKPYKGRTQAKTYTLPFGKTSTNPTYGEAAKALIAAAKAASTVVGASCRPEDLIV